MLKRQEGYLLKHIHEKTYLLPFGQNIADQKRGSLLNEAGEFLWNALETPQELSSLEAQLASYYQLDSTYLEELHADTEAFIQQLLSLGILREEFHCTKKNYCRTMQIADILIHFYGPEKSVSKQFAPFFIEDVPSRADIDTDFHTAVNSSEQRTDMTPLTDANLSEQRTDTTPLTDAYLSEQRTDNKPLPVSYKSKNPENLAVPCTSMRSVLSEVEIEILSTTPLRHQNGKVLLRNQDMTIHEWDEGYIVFFPEFKNISETYITKDGRYVRIHCNGVFNKTELDNIFHAIRLFFLYHAQLRGYFALHSASILYRDKAWLFSGHSGMGKSTHTALWHELLQTPYLNGDLNLIGIKNGIPVIYGIPWCGTSEIFTTECHELGGIVLLGRDITDHVEELESDEKVLRVMQRMISPAWTGEMVEKNLGFSEKLVDLIQVWNLYCTKNPSAVYTIKEEIDKIYSK